MPSTSKRQCLAAEWGTVPSSATNMVLGDGVGLGRATTGPLAIAVAVVSAACGLLQAASGARSSSVAAMERVFTGKRRLRKGLRALPAWLRFGSRAGGEASNSPSPEGQGLKSSSPSLPA